MVPPLVSAIFPRAKCGHTVVASLIALLALLGINPVKLQS